jgi:hypothetical protein
LKSLFLGVLSVVLLDMQNTRFAFRNGRIFSKETFFSTMAGMPMAYHARFRMRNRKKYGDSIYWRVKFLVFSPFCAQNGAQENKKKRRK